MNPKLGHACKLVSALFCHIATTLVNVARYVPKYGGKIDYGDADDDVWQIGVVGKHPTHKLARFTRDEIREFTNKILHERKLCQKSTNKSCSGWVIIIIKFLS